MTTANVAQKVSAYQACTAPKVGDVLMVLSANLTPNAVQPYITKHCNVEVLYSNTNLTTNSIHLTYHTTPMSNSASGLQVGQMWADDDYLYVVCTGKIRRVALSDFY